MDTATTLSRDIAELVERIQAYSQSQQEIWQQLPYWASEADGRSGSIDELSRMYSGGLMAIDSPMSPAGGYQFFVDLGTGIIVDTGISHQPGQPVTPSSRPAILSIKLNLLDAQAHLDQLKIRSQKPHHESYDPIKHDQMRQEWQRRHNLAPNKPYVRHRSIGPFYHGIGD